MIRKDYQTYRITCASPVFVGNGEIWNPGQYLYDSRQEKVFFLNEHQWLQFLYREKKFPQFSKYIIECTQKERTVSLFSWVQSELIQKKCFHSMEEAVSAMKKEGVIQKEEKVEIGSNRYKEKQSANEIHSFVRNGRGQCYIPGSTLKGAFRTAVLFQILHRQQEKYRDQWSKISHASVRDFERIGKDLEMIMTVPEEHRNNRSELVLWDCFRGLSVSDAEITEERLGIVQKWDWGNRAAAERKDPQSISLFREVLLPGASLEFSLSVDPDIMKPLGIASVDGVLAAVRAWTDYQYELLHPAFGGKAQYLLNSIKKADLILGGGTGFFNKTLLYPLAPGREEAVSTARRLMTERFRRHHHDRDYEISPHTLKLTRWNNEFCLMGLCRLEALC